MGLNHIVKQIACVVVVKVFLQIWSLIIVS